MTGVDSLFAQVLAGMWLVFVPIGAGVVFAIGAYLAIQLGRAGWRFRLNRNWRVQGSKKIHSFCFILASNSAMRISRSCSFFSNQAISRSASGS